MVTKELRMAATEVNQILKYTEEKDVNKIPLGLRLFLKDIEDGSYHPNINPETSLFEHKLTYEAEMILGMIYCYYWSDEEELKQIPQKVIDKAIETNKNVFGKFDEEKYFEGQKERQKNSLEASTIIVHEDKEPWYKKVFGFLKK